LSEPGASPLAKSAAPLAAILVCGERRRRREPQNAITKVSTYLHCPRSSLTQKRDKEIYISRSVGAENFIGAGVFDAGEDKLAKRDGAARAGARLAGALVNLALRRWRDRASAPGASAAGGAASISDGDSGGSGGNGGNGGTGGGNGRCGSGGGGGGGGGLARAALLALGGAAAGFWLSENLRPLRRAPAPSPAPPSSSSSSSLDSPEAAAILGGAAPSLLFRRVSQNFVAEYDSATRNPRWVVERLAGQLSSSLSSSSYPAAAAAGAPAAESRAGHAFREDKGLPPDLRARLADYEGSGYDRGHLAPAADNRASAAAMHDSFLLTNVSPQVGAGFNRDYWARLEAFVRGAARRFQGDTFVCTGPLFLPRPVADGGGGGFGGDGAEADAAVAAAAAAVAAAAGAPAPRWAYAHAALGQAPRWLAVPTHFFKVVVSCGADGRAAAAAAFVVPNARVAAEARLADFAVPLAALEAAAGLRFFRDLLGDEEAKLALDAAAEAHQLQRSPQQHPQHPQHPQHLALARNAARVLLAPPPAPAAASPPVSAGMAALAAAPGPRHLCTVIDCTLPAEKWFEKKGGGER